MGDGVWIDVLADIPNAPGSPESGWRRRDGRVRWHMERHRFRLVQP
jgi:hypothetical protein